MTTVKHLVAIRSTGNRTPLFLIHSIAGELSWLQPLAKALPVEQPLYGFAAPGLNSDAPFFNNLAEMAAAYIHDLRTVQPRGPYVLGGYSFGGVVAFEMAHQLLRANEQVDTLILLDSFAPTPGLKRALATWTRNGLLLQVVSNLFCLNLKATDLIPAGYLPAGDLAAQTEAAARYLQEHCIIPYTFETLRGYLSRCQTVMCRHSELLAAYQPRPLTHPVRTLLLHNTLGLIGYKSALRLPKLPDGERNPPHGWDELLLRPPARIAIQGEHFMLGVQPAITEIARALRDTLKLDTKLG